jgi:fido (protein-threonine AMPylation protein)
MADINRRIVAAVGEPPDGDREKAAALADIFMRIIKVHPFKDGNGRTARVAVQYCLRSWGMDYIVIPKVRNDPVWKAALGAAMDGSLQAMTAFLVERMAR